MFFGFNSVTVAYGKSTVLRRVTLEVAEGEIVTLIGKNGTGKSSLLRTVSRAVTPTEGSVIYMDRPADQYPRRELARQIAFLPQITSAPPDLDVATLVSYGRYPHRGSVYRPTAEDRRAVAETLGLMELDRLASRPLSTLSGGELRRAWLAMTVCRRPRVLVLDEPVTYLDVAHGLQVLELIRELNRRHGMTVLMVLHDLNLAARYSHRLVALGDGGIMAEGAPDTVLTEQNLESIFGIDATLLTDTRESCPIIIPRAKKEAQ